MEWVTAIGTGALVITALLAYASNRKLVKASEAQAGLAQEVVNRQAIARLVPGDPEAWRLGEEIATEVGPQTFRTRRLHIGIENAGAAVATITAARATSAQRGEYNVWAPPAVPAAAERTLKLTLPGGTPLELQAGEKIELRVDYFGLDAVGRALAFTAEYYPGGGWLVRTPPATGIEEAGSRGRGAEAPRGSA